MKTKFLTLKQLVKKIAKDNTKFAKMSKADKRIEIAQDCIVRIKQEQLIVETGRVITYNADWVNNESIMTEINDDSCDFECTVCAKGALFMSYVGRVNDFNFVQIEDDTYHSTREIKKLLEIFTDKQLILIETYFEGRQVVKEYKGNCFYFDDDVIDYAYNFELKTKSDTRLIMICENIIENNGTFKPKLLKY